MSEADLKKATVARPIASEEGHWYTKDGKPAYEMPLKDGSGMRNTTLRDARKLKLLPSVTTIIKSVLRSPALERWKIEQAVLAVATASRLDGEALDAFIDRVLRVEKQQDAEAAAARERGTAIHAALEQAVVGKEWDRGLAEYVEPVLNELKAFGAFRASEKVIVGDGYAGKTDYVADTETITTLVDFKTAKTIPDKEPWDEHKLQLSAYAVTLPSSGRQVKTCIIYISTVVPGTISVLFADNHQETYERGFKPLLDYWMWRNNYNPNL